MKQLALVAVALVASSSAAFAAPTTKSDFLKYLARDYNSLSFLENSTESGDVRLQPVFKDRALRSSAGEYVAPMVIDSGKFLPEMNQYLSTERNQLVGVLRAGAIQGSPRDAAKAQSMFDCMVVQKSLPKASIHSLPNCEGSYKTVIAKLSAEYPMPVKRVMPVDAMAKDAADVFFAFDSAELSGDAKAKLDRVIDAIARKGSKKIVVIGHTDTTGSPEYNKVLSQKRAKAVADYVREGLDKRVDVKTRGVGQEHLRVETADNVANQANRFARIRF